MKLIFSVLSALFGIILVSAQPSSICEKHYLNQLNRLRNGVLIVELEANPNQSAGIVDTRSAEGQQELATQREARAMFEAFKLEFEFSEVVFRFQDENGNSTIINTAAEVIKLEKDSSAVFIARQVGSDPGGKECAFEYRDKENQWSQKNKQARDKKFTEFDQRMLSFNPEYIDQGGIVIEPLSSELSKVKKKKRVASKFIYRSRLNSLTPIESRYKESVSYFRKNLKKKASEYSRRLG